MRHYESVTTQLNVRKEELENVYNDLQKHMNEAEQLRPFKAKFNTIKVESDVLKKQLAESLKKFQEVEKTCEKIQNDLKRSNENIDTLTEDLEEKTNDFEKISKKNEKLKENVTNLKVELADTREKNEEYMETILSNNQIYEKNIDEMKTTSEKKIQDALAKMEESTKKAEEIQLVLIIGLYQLDT